MKRSEQRFTVENSYLMLERAVAEESSKEKHFNVENLSRGGIRFCSDESFELEERVKLDLYIEGKHSHHANGRICYHDEDKNHQHYYGVSFLDKYLHL